MIKINLNDIDWKRIQNLYDNGLSIKLICEQCNISREILNKGCDNKLFFKRKNNYKMLDETKEKIRIGRIKYLIDNPDKHNWKNNKKFISIPCEKFKDLLKSQNILFISEYSPSLDRFYSLDVAFPHMKIGVEINGNQHYNKDGTLKEYYQIRHNYLESIGWKIYEIHFSIVYNNEMLNNLIDSIAKFSLNQDDYDFYLKKIIDINNSKINHCIDCGKIIKNNSKRCVECKNVNLRKVSERPDRDTLINEINNSSFTSVGKKYGVSDNAIRKWIK